MVSLHPVGKCYAINIEAENTADRPEEKRAWNEIYQWVQAAMVKRNLRYTKFGFLGNTYSGMLDLCN